MIQIGKIEKVGQTGKKKRTKSLLDFILFTPLIIKLQVSSKRKRQKKNKGKNVCIFQIRP